MSVLSLGLLVPFGLGSMPERTVALLTGAQTPTKYVNENRGTDRAELDGHPPTAAALRQRGIAMVTDDRFTSGADPTLAGGESTGYGAAVSVTLVSDGVSRPVTTAASTVGALLAARHVRLAEHDRVDPPVSAPLRAGTTIRVVRATSWLEHVHTSVPAPIRHTFDVALAAGTQRVVEPGRAGSQETTVEVLQPDPSIAPKRAVLAARILRFPRARVIAEGVGDYSSLAGIARRSMSTTLRLADQALRMVATAYTSSCSGCSGMTASGARAGRGIVAVDPHLIPLGTHLFIPGYGHAFAGDTGGSIRGHRIDLGFDSDRDARSFGRRQVVVYVLK